MTKTISFFVSLFLLLSVLAHPASAASVSQAIKYKWKSESFKIASMQSPLIGHTGNVSMIYKVQANKEDYFPSTNSFRVFNSKGKTVAKLTDFKSNLLQIQDVKDGVILLDGGTLKKVNLKGKKIWSKKLSGFNQIHVGKDGKLYVTSSKKITYLNVKNGKTPSSYKHKSTATSIEFDPKSQNFYVFRKGYVDAVKNNKKVWTIKTPKGYSSSSLVDISPTGTVAINHYKSASGEFLLHVYSSAGKLKWKYNFKEGILNDSYFNTKGHLLVQDVADWSFKWFDSKGKIINSFKLNDEYNDARVFSVTKKNEVYVKYWGYNRDFTKQYTAIRKLSKTGKVLKETKLPKDLYSYFTYEEGVIETVWSKGKVTLKFYLLK